MPDIRTTRVALLVDREVDRDVRTSKVALLVDRETDVTLVTETFIGIVDIELAVDHVVEEIYLIADIEEGHLWAEAWTHAGEFTYIAGEAGELWADTHAQEDQFDWLAPIERDFEDTQEPADVFDLIFEIIVEHSQEDAYDYLKVRRADLLTLYNSIVGYLNNWGTKTVPPGNPLYDINDDGWITSSDALYVSIWYTSGICNKFARIAWTQTDQFVVSVQALTLVDTQQQSDSWLNPETQTAVFSVSQQQTDTWNISSDQARFQDIHVQDQIFDPSFPAKQRDWVDTWAQSEHWSLLNWTETWEQTSSFIRGLTTETLVQTWAQSDSFKPPIPRVLNQIWSQSSMFDLLDIYAGVTIEQEQNDIWHASIQSVEYYDWFGEYSSVEQYSYTRDPVRDWSDTINWSESWRVVLPTEELADTQTQVDVFDNEILWDKFEDTQTVTETWSEVAGLPIIIEDEQEDSFSYTHNAIKSVSLTFDTEDYFVYLLSEPTTCPVIPKGTLALIDTTETLVLKNPRWGNTTNLEITRTIGATRSGTPYVGRRPYWPRRETYKYKITGLSDTQLDSIINFIERNTGGQIRWCDYYGNYHFGFLLEPATPAIRRSRNRGEIELTLIDLGDREAHCRVYWEASDEVLIV